MAKRTNIRMLRAVDKTTGENKLQELYLEPCGITYYPYMNSMGIHYRDRTILTSPVEEYIDDNGRGEFEIYTTNTIYLFKGE